MRKLKDVCKRTLISVLSSVTALAVFTGAAVAQVPSFTPPPVQPSTFVAAVSFSPVVTAGDVACIYGSASRLIKIKSITLRGVIATAAATVLFNVVKRSAVDTGGTPVVATAAAFDSGQIITAPTAVVSSYTAVPTGIGTSAGVVGQRHIALFLAATPTVTLSQETWEWFPSELYSDVRLRTATQGLCLNVPTAFPNVPTLDVEIVWTEQ